MKTLFHFTFFGLFAYVCYFDANIVSGKYLPIPNQFLSKFVWLTLIDLYLQTFYHFIGFVVSIVSPNRRHPIFDYFARAIIGPIGVAVTVLFWALWIFDPATLANDEMGRKILAIKWFNHGLHTLPLISAHFDLFFWNHTVFSKPAILKGISAFVVFYLIDIHYVHHISGFWAYPILGELSLPFRSVFFGVCIVVVYLSYLWTSLVHYLIHGSIKQSKTKRG